MEKQDKTIIARAMAIWTYCNTGVWSDNRRKWWIKPLRTLNLSMRSFFNSDIQTQACAMTYRTLLAIVPALAILFAIGRGFGLQSLLEKELMGIFPSQGEVVGRMLGFVDSYLEQSSEGLFVGVGLVFLIYTVINLVSNVEDTFNRIWCVGEGRSFWRKITDYTAMLLILPVLLICAGGLSMLLSNGIQSILNITHLSFLGEIFIEIGSWAMICLFFTAVFMLIPNTRVNLKYALLAGALSGTGFMVLQWLFISGQLYVARYNAIYGSFSLLPLFFIWLQFTWMICLVGAVICYSSQNVYGFSFTPEISRISPAYRRKIILAVTSVVANRFKNGQKPITEKEMVAQYSIPPKTVTATVERLIEAGVLARGVVDIKQEELGIVPARDLDTLTVAFVFESINKSGNKDFVPNFDKKFAAISKLVDKMEADFFKAYGSKRVVDLQFALPDENDGRTSPAHA